MCVCACMRVCVCVVVVTKDNPQGDVGRRNGRIEQMSWPRRQEEMGKISEGGSALCIDGRMQTANNNIEKWLIY